MAGPYRRVIPRDLFNEASLLKCYGQLFIAMEKLAGNRGCFSQEDVASFNIGQREDDGAIRVQNLTLVVGEHEYRLMRPLNSRQPWPLWAEKIGDLDFEPLQVFNDDGTLTTEMVLLLTVG